MVSSQYRIIALQEEVGRSITATAPHGPRTLLANTHKLEKHVSILLVGQVGLYILQHVFD